MLNQEVVCIIPARGGSKGIPNKNLKSFHGKSLLRITIEQALSCKSINRLIVSTDSEEIATEAKKYNAEVPFLRPNYLANSEIHSSKVILHCLDWLKRYESYDPDYVLMLLTTSPLRNEEDIEKCINIIKNNNYDSLVSVCDLGKNLNNLRTLYEGKLGYPFEKIDFHEQRQTQKKLFGVNGSIFLAKVCQFLKYESFHLNNTYGYIMDYLNSIDINTQEDFDKASFIFERISRK